MFFNHELHEWARTSSFLIRVITLRQLVLSANRTNVVRVFDWQKIRVIRNCTSNSSCNENRHDYLFRENSCNSWLK